MEESSPEAVEEAFERAASTIREDSESVLFTPVSIPGGYSAEFTGMNPLDFVEQAVEVGAEVFYLMRTYTENEELATADLAYYYQNRLHGLSVMTEKAHQDAEPTQSDAFGFSEQSSEERERKQEVADEVLREYDEYLDDEARARLETELETLRLTEVLRIKRRAEETKERTDLANEILDGYGEYLEEDERARLEGDLDYRSVSSLERLKREVEERARVDPDEEIRLAEIVAEDERFGRNFNQTDTEMLLNALDVEYEEEEVRIEEIHKRAKSILKIKN